jgi:hypothetical protein
LGVKSTFLERSAIQSKTSGVPSPAGSACYFLIIIFISHETTAAARWALLVIVRTLSNDAIAVAVWTGFGFHVCLPVDVSIEWRRG